MSSAMITTTLGRAAAASAMVAVAASRNAHTARLFGATDIVGSPSRSSWGSRSPDPCRQCADRASASLFLRRSLADRPELGIDACRLEIVREPRDDVRVLRRDVLL